MKEKMLQKTVAHYAREKTSVADNADGVVE